MEKKVEAIIWSIALPGFAQLLNRSYVKGILLILIEIVVNVQGNLNTLIVLSFQGYTEEAVQQADYLWIMFYPCLYFFAIWDAYKEAGGDGKPYMAIPFASAAFITTIGVAYSSQAIVGVVIGPIFLPILSSFVGLGIGFGARKIIKTLT
ncbi:hypothetical protein HUG15_21790 [Salicibibacter cibarius]|uniref:Uncharacterized protein n=1 Tax=Salicibibacter cibarius TaxID=2743000 RepID=A0A7T6Z6U4_9BACI|nr:hypothetical protein [Salicibibacter cibarius]QQK77950.1 hypothetical protein HUG15_21790 [Salicibibacter cibarius]